MTALVTLAAHYPAPRTLDPASALQMHDAALCVDGVSLSFGGVRALENVTLQVAPREIRAIIGPNGAGKSSLLNVITGLYRPDHGRIRLSGEEYRQVPTARLAHLSVARTFQNLALFKGLSLLDNVVMGLAHTFRGGMVAQLIGTQAARRERNAAYDRARDVLTFFHLDAYCDRSVGELPYGIQKRAELARALVGKPRLLLLDEPMAGMTPSDRRELSQYIRTARDTLGTTVVLIEHDMGVVMSLSDRVAVLDYGRKIADGPAQVVREDPAVIDAYLGVPHDEAIVES